MLLLVLSTDLFPPPGEENARTASPDRNVVWLGPGPPPWQAATLATAGRFSLPSAEGRCSAAQIYTALNLLLAKAWNLQLPKKATIVERHMAAAAHALEAVLNDEGLLEGLQRMAADNARYPSAFLISPFAGAGRVWERAFDAAGRLMMVHHPPGQSGHGPIVTIDGRADEKFVGLGKREDMVARYGKSTVRHWESQYLEGKSIDAFLARPPSPPLRQPQAPFYAGHHWYLPILLPDYETRQDNLIILDMTGERALPAMLDELSLLGSRVPRLVVITQEDRLRQVGAETFFSFPVSNLLVLPTVGGAPIADLHLPLVLNALGVVLADLWQAASPG